MPQADTPGPGPKAIRPRVGAHELFFVLPPRDGPENARECVIWCPEANETQRGERILRMPVAGREAASAGRRPGRGGGGGGGRNDTKRIPALGPGSSLEDVSCCLDALSGGVAGGSRGASAAGPPATRSRVTNFCEAGDRDGRRCCCVLRISQLLIALLPLVFSFYSLQPQARCYVSPSTSLICCGFDHCRGIQLFFWRSFDHAPHSP